MENSNYVFLNALLNAEKMLLNENSQSFSAKAAINEINGVIQEITDFDRCPCCGGIKLSFIVENDCNKCVNCDYEWNEL